MTLEEEAERATELLAGKLLRLFGVTGQEKSSSSSKTEAGFSQTPTELQLSFRLPSEIKLRLLQLATSLHLWPNNSFKAATSPLNSSVRHHEIPIYMGLYPSLGYLFWA
jgi:hypothetical protein